MEALALQSVALDAFQGAGNLCMAALPIAIPFGQGAVVPQSLDELLDAIEASVGQS